MIILDNQKNELERFRKILADARESIKLDELIAEKKELDAQMAADNLWDDVGKANKVTARIKQVTSKIEKYERMVAQFEDLETLIEMAQEADDEAYIPEIDAEIAAYVPKIEALKLETLLKGEYDSSNAVLSLHAGAGGTEAQDWVSMLYRMYLRWSEIHDYEVKILEYLDGEEAGIKSCSMMITGENAYGFLRSEIGVHRLVRISPFNAQAKRQTSFVSCMVMPVIPQNNDIVIEDKDLRIDTYRSSGAGGQHINKTSSAIRITHIPTGIVVTCQNERSQFQNKDKAFEMLRAKLFELKQEEEEAKSKGIAGDIKDSAWGNQIRSYFLQPYTMVTDKRTGYKTSDALGVLDGKLDQFIVSFLKWKSTGGEEVGGDDEDV